MLRLAVPLLGPAAGAAGAGAAGVGTMGVAVAGAGVVADDEEEEAIGGGMEATSAYEADGAAAKGVGADGALGPWPGMIGTGCPCGRGALSPLCFGAGAALSEGQDGSLGTVAATLPPANAPVPVAMPPD